MVAVVTTAVTEAVTAALVGDVVVQIVLRRKTEAQRRQLICPRLK